MAFIPIRHGLVGVILVLALRAGAAPLEFQSKDAVPRVITFDEWIASRSSSSLPIPLKNYTSGRLELFDASASVEARSQRACEVDVANSQFNLWGVGAGKNDRCQALLKPLFENRTTRLALSKPGSSDYALVVYAPPKGYVGASSSISADAFKSLRIPSDIKRTADKPCYLLLLSEWHGLKCSAEGAVSVPPSEPSIEGTVDAALDAGRELELVLHVQDADSVAGDWRSFRVRRDERQEKFQKNNSGETTDGTGMETGDGTSLASRCRKSIAAQDLALKTPFYVACVDVHPGGVGLFTVEVTGTQGGYTYTVVGDLLHSGRNLVVFVWSVLGSSIQISLGGLVGENTVYRGAINEPVNKALDEVPVLSTLQIFSSRKSGPAKLKVVSTRNGKSIDWEFTYTYEAYYKMALRIGFGATWSPWSREFGLGRGAQGELVSAVLTGGGSGVVTTGLMAGVTYFPCEVAANSSQPVFGVGARLGLVGQTGGNNLRAFDSLQLGVEGGLGLDFSVGLFGGLVLDRRPKAGFEVGKVLPVGTSSIETQMGVAPGFSLVVNFTPGFLGKTGDSL